MNEFQPIEIERLDKEALWPGGKKLAIVFNIAYEMWTPDSCSTVNPMGNVLSGDIKDPNADSYGQYNANSGCKRLLEIANRFGVRASLFTSGLVAEHQAEELKRISDSGHEIIGHSYGQNMLFPYLNEEQANDTIARSTQLIEQATGHRPSGWISPRITSDPSIHRKLSQHGYQWHGDALDDDLPYLQKFPDGEIMAIPVTVDFNDLPHAMRFGRTPEQFVHMFNTALDKLMASSRETLVLDIIVHGHCYGRPCAAWAFEDIVRRCSQQKELWLTTRSQIFDHVRPMLGK